MGKETYQYATFENFFQNKGLQARYAVDRSAPGTYLNLQNITSLQENALSSRYGISVINQNGVQNFPLVDGTGTPNNVTMLARLRGLSNAATRYAVVPPNLYALANSLTGQYTLISQTLTITGFSRTSGIATYVTSTPTLLESGTNVYIENCPIANTNGLQQITNTPNSTSISTTQIGQPDVAFTATTGSIIVDPVTGTLLQPNQLTSSFVYRLNNSSTPNLFIADPSNMIKHAGGTVPAQQWGIFAPTIPPTVTVESPYFTTVESFDKGVFLNATSSGFTIVNATVPNIPPLRFIYGITVPAVAAPTPFTVTPLFSIVTLAGAAGVVTVTLSTNHNIPLGSSLLAAVSGAPTESNQILNGVFEVTATSPVQVTFPSNYTATTSVPGMMLSLMPSVQDGMMLIMATGGFSSGVQVVVFNVTDTSFQITPPNVASFTGFLYGHYAQLTCAAGATSSISKVASLDLNNFASIAAYGPNVTQTGANGTGVGTAWVNPGNVSSNVAYATVSYSAGGSSVLLYATNAGFALPLNVNISGILVTFTASLSDPTALFEVVLIYGGLIYGGPKFANPSTTPSTVTLGGELDAWRASFAAPITSTIVNSTTFGIFILVSGGTAATITAQVNNVQITAFTSTLVAGINPVSPDDYIMMAINIDNPANVVQMGLYFDVGDGTFTRDYYWATFTPPGYQPAITGTQSSPTALSNYVYERATGLANISQLGVDNSDLLPTDLPNLQGLRPNITSSGNAAWSNIKSLISEFVAVGNAGVGAQNWGAVTAWQVTIQTQISTPSVVGIDDIYLGGGSGVDSWAGSPYDYRYTYYNANTGGESNPSAEMVVNDYITPQRQPILLQMAPPLDEQVTHERIYRRGGGLTAEWFFVDQVPTTNALTDGFATYIDVLSDETISASGQVLSITNDVPVTATLAVPVNTTIVYIYPLFVYALANGTIAVIDSLVPHGLSDGEAITLNIVNVGVVAYTVNTVLSSTSFNVLSTLPAGTYPGTVTPTILAPAIQEPITFITSTGVYPVTYQNVVYVVPASMANIYPNQELTIGPTADQEVCIVIATTPTSFVTVLQNLVTAIPSPPTPITFNYTHALGEQITAGARQGTPCNISCVAFETAFLAGDPYNPHFLYYSVPENPELFPPENFVEIGSPRDPIMAVVEFNGALYAFTANTIWTIYYSPGTVPQAYPSGAKHGLAAQAGWAVTENAIFYISYDGIYAFAGGAATLVSEATAWIWTGKNNGPVAAIDTTRIYETTMAFANNEELFVSYIDQTGTKRRLIWSQIYKRWRNDTVAASSMLFEDDTYQLLIGGVGNGLVYQDLTNQSFDDAGYAGGALQTVPINFVLQTAYMDQGEMKAEKNYNELTIDANTNGQNLTVTLLFNAGELILPIGTLNTAQRQPVNFNINSGLGQLARNCSLQLSGSVTAEVDFFEGHLRGVIEAEYRQSFDSYFDKFGTDMFKIFKQGWFEYMALDSGGINFSIYLDSATVPVFTFNLPQSSVRATERVRFPAIKCKIWRMVATSASDFRFYGDSHIEWKISTDSKGWMSTKMQT
jgi:hypothetical protein